MAAAHYSDDRTADGHSSSCRRTCSVLDPGRCRRCREILEADGKKPSPPGTTDPLATVGAALNDALAREYDPAEMADFVKFALEQEGFGTETLARAMEKTPGDPPGRCLGEPVADVEVVHLRYEITLSAAVNLETGRVEELIRLNHEQGEPRPVAALDCRGRQVAPALAERALQIADEDPDWKPLE